MKLYNGLTRTLEPFAPAAAGQNQRSAVTLYVCGITPYDTTHLGHAFTYTVFDVLVRFLEHQGHTVRYVQNVTDIDDDILRKSKEGGDTAPDAWLALGNRWTQHFITDLQALNVRPPDFYPRATDVIAEIIASVEALMAAGVAYESAANVYFQIDAWPAFGQLSQIPRPEMLAIANQRGNFADDPHKRDPLDFVLWQAQKPGEPAWQSPWGPGRPGWHIECSTMSTQLLGSTIDIHGGGGDLLFPHHECEIAQIEPITRQPFVRFWMHAAMVYHEGEKMSKSLGNLIMIRDLLKTTSPDAIRLYLASHHYRSSWSYDAGELQQAQALADDLAHCAASPGSGRQGQPPLRPDQQAALALHSDLFHAALADDLNTPTALHHLHDLARQIRQFGEEGYDVETARAMLRACGRIFGLRLDASAPEERVLAGWDAHRQRFL